MKKVSISVLLILLSTNNLFTSKCEKVLYDPTVFDLNDVCILSEQNIVAVGEYGTVRYSADSGKNWAAQLIPGRPNLMGIAKRDSNTVFAVANKGSIFYSKDRGVSWVTADAGQIPTTEDLNDIAFYDDKKGVIAGNNGTVLVTSDGGISWFLAGNKNDENLRSIAYANGTTLVCAGDKGAVLVSTNSGNDWSPRESKTKANLKIVRAPDEKHIYIVGDSLTVTISNDIGESWKCGKLDTTNSYFRRPEIFGCVFFDSLSGIVRVDDRYNSNGAIQSEITTTDGGLTWYYYDLSGSFSPRANNLVNFEFLNRDFGISVGRKGEIVLLHFYGYSIEYMKSFYGSAHTFQKIITEGASNILAVYNTTKSYEAIQSEDAGATWKTLPRFDTIGSKRGISIFQDVSYPEKNTIYMALNNAKDSSWVIDTNFKSKTTYSGYILRSTDNGITWKEKVFPSKAKISSLIMVDKLHGIAELEKKYVYRTNNGWATYDSVFVPDTTVKHINKVFYREKGRFFISATKNDNSVIYYSSSDEGITWDSTPGPPDNSRNINLISNDKVISWNILYDSINYKYYDNIYISGDKGKNWSLALNEKSRKPHDISGIYFNNNYGIAFKNNINDRVTDYYFTFDSGVSWKMDSVIWEEGADMIAGLAYLNHETIFIVCTGGAMLKYDFWASPVLEEFHPVLPDEFSLAPNPASEYIYINGVVDGKEIRIYSSLGLKVYESSFVNKIDVSSIAPGVYFLISGAYKARFVKVE